MNVCLFDAEPEAAKLWNQLAPAHDLKVSVYSSWQPGTSFPMDTHLVAVDRSALSGGFAEGVIEIRGACPCLALTIGTGNGLLVGQVVEMMRHGVYHVLEKPYDAQQLDAMLGELRGIATDIEASRDEHQHLKSLFETLTHREKHVLDCVLAGDSNKEAARKLNVSVRTVESRRAKVYRKLELKHVAELVRKIDRLDQLNTVFDMEATPRCRFLPHPCMLYLQRNRQSDGQAC